MGLVLGLRKGTEEVRGKRKVKGKEMDDKCDHGDDYACITC